MSLDWTAIGATATGIAAIVTAWMANETREAANAGRDAAKASQEMIVRADKELELLGKQTAAIATQASVSLRALQSAAMPILIPVTPHEKFSSTDNKAHRIDIRSTDNHMHPISIQKLFSRIEVTSANNEMTWAQTYGLKTITEDTQTSAKILWFILEFKNIGTGPALVTQGSQSGTADTPGVHVMGPIVGERLLLSFQAQSPVIAAGDTGYFAARIETCDGAILDRFRTESKKSRAATEFAIQVTYENLQRVSKYELHCGYEIAENLDLVPVAPRYKGDEEA
ncbi:hypothetical protein [Ferrimicrobium acidiphilum]|uniref:hypothetical protein n=1 Tax=Ferrimicrobium acidiphilum TaxID=121039 RepID=UPI0023F2428E|nr:hypothetical protein [Ferrimicrobium acidiphilum]